MFRHVQSSTSTASDEAREDTPPPTTPPPDISPLPLTSLDCSLPDEPTPPPSTPPEFSPLPSTSLDCSLPDEPPPPPSTPCPLPFPDLIDIDNSDSEDQLIEIENSNINSNNTEEVCESITTVSTQTNGKRPAASALNNNFHDKSGLHYEHSYEHLFYYSFSDEGWFCKVCTAFAAGPDGKRAFIDKPAKNVKDHPTQRFNEHLKTDRHQHSVKNKHTYDEMSKRNLNVWKLTMNSALADQETKRSQNRFVIKSFFRIVLTMVRKNWVHTENFPDVVKLVAECGGKEIKNTFTYFTK